MTVACLVFVMFVLGGGSALTPLVRMKAEMIGLALLLIALWRLQPGRFWQEDRGAAIILAALIALIGAQLVPLPPATWTALPGRDLARTGDLLMFGTIPARPLSLDPEATLRAALVLVPALGVYLTVRTTDARSRHRLVWTIVAFACASLLLALAQIWSGHATWSHLYVNAQSMLPTGVFANRNHQAMLMVVTIPLLGAAVAESRRLATIAQRNRLPIFHVRLLSFAVVAMLLVIGALVSGSRTGAVLLVPALVGGAVIATRTAFGSRRRAIVVAAAMLVVVAMIGWAVSLGHGPLAALAHRSLGGDDNRLRSWPQVLTVLRGYFPAGSGFGTFRSVYDAAEPLTLLGPLYLNHAHNDWMEIILEGGAAAVLLLAAFLVWFAVRAVTTLRTSLDRPGTSLGRAAALSATCLLVHSLVDYPLRTICLCAIFAACLAWLSPAATERAKSN
jgi:O-antigen ligase